MKPRQRLKIARGMRLSADAQRGIKRYTVPPRWQWARDAQAFGLYPRCSVSSCFGQRPAFIVYWIQRGVSHRSLRCERHARLFCTRHGIPMEGL